MATFPVNHELSTIIGETVYEAAKDRIAIVGEQTVCYPQKADPELTARILTLNRRLQQAGVLDLPFRARICGMYVGSPRQIFWVRLIGSGV